MHNLMSNISPLEDVMPRAAPQSVLPQLPALPWKPAALRATSPRTASTCLAGKVQRQQEEQHTAHTLACHRGLLVPYSAFLPTPPALTVKEKLHSFLTATTLPKSKVVISQTGLQHFVFYIILMFESLRFSPGMSQFQYQLHRVELSGIFQPPRLYLNLHP